VRALLPGSRTELPEAMEKIRRLVRERPASSAPLPMGVALRSSF